MRSLTPSLTPYTNFENLPRGDYRVKSFSLVNTTFGTVIRVDLADKYLPLPKRFIEDQDEKSIAILNSSPKVMEYRGKDSACSIQTFLLIYLFFNNK